MFSIASNSGEVAYGVTRFLIDTEAEIKDLPTYHTPGSSAFVIENSTRYILNNNREWIKVASSNSGGGSTNPDDNVQIGMFSCLFTNGNIMPGSISGVNTAGNDTVQAADITSLVKYLAPLDNIRTIKIEIIASEAAAASACSLIFNSIENVPVADGYFNTNALTLQSLTPETDFTSVLLKPYNFNTANVVTFSLRISITLKEVPDVEDVFYDGGSI